MVERTSSLFEKTVQRKDVEIISTTDAGLFAQNEIKKCSVK